MEDSHKMSGSRILSRKAWEARFDAELKNEDPKQAWETLLEHQCDPRALKSALYYAADFLWHAQQVGRVNEFYSKREESLTQVAQLKNTIRQLMAFRMRGAVVATGVMRLSDVNKIDMRFFQRFPTQLVRFEKILKVLNLPVGTRPDLDEFHLVARGEALLHLYVKEVTTKVFPGEAAALLDAAAAAARIDYAPEDYVPEYSTDAVSKRYRRFRSHRSSDLTDMLVLTSWLKKHKRTFVDDFLHLQKTKLSFEWALWQLLFGDTDWARRLRRSTGLKRWPSRVPRS